jgi:hypothetical protein
VLTKKQTGLLQTKIHDLEEMMIGRASVPVLNDAAG